MLRQGGVNVNAERVERRLAAILAADVAGYSRLMGEDEEGTIARLKAHRSDLIDAKVAEHRGRIVKTTGDGLLIEFPSVVEAVSCALAMQRAMVERNGGIPVEQQIVFRIGINLGDIIVEDGDIHGDGVNIAARLEGIAEPGCICISEDVFRQVRDKIAAVTDIGEQSLKNIVRPLRIFRVVPQAPADARPATQPLPDKPSIAVLPFENMSGDPEQEFFADGITEDITSALSKIRWFFVIARNSSFTYKSRTVDVKQVGRELGVRYLLEGSVRKSSNRIRITAQLVDAATGNHIWAERYDREVADIFAVQDEITERVVAAIEPELYAAENLRSRRKAPENLDAWECVIRALSHIGQVTHPGTTEAEVLCRRAIEIAPDYGQAHSLLAWTLVRRPLWSGDLRTVLPEATAEARTALSLDDRDPWAHLAEGAVFFRMHRHGEAERAVRRALELNPNFAPAHAYLGAALAIQGMYDEAVKYTSHALRLSPNDRVVGGFASVAAASAHFAAGHYPECIASARETIDRYPDHQAPHHLLIAAAAMQGDMTAAAEALASLLRLRPDSSLTWVRENTPFAGELLERLLEGLCRAGVPEV
jgi:adenylate cyclase